MSDPFGPFQHGDDGELDNDWDCDNVEGDVVHFKLICPKCGQERIDTRTQQIRANFIPENEGKFRHAPNRDHHLQMVIKCPNCQHVADWGDVYTFVSIHAAFNAGLVDIVELDRRIRQSRVDS